MARKARSIDDTSKNDATPVDDTLKNVAESIQTSDADKESQRKEDLLNRAKKYFERSEAWESEQRTNERDDIEFVGLLKQWPDDIRFARENDPQGARPCLTVDKVNQYKNQIVNQIRQNRPGIKIRPVDDNADIEVAEIFQGLIRHIEDDSKADQAYDWAAEGAVDSGLGYILVTTEYCGNSFDQKIMIKRVANRFSCYAPPESIEPDGSDYEEFGIAELISREAFKREYPNADPVNFNPDFTRDYWWRDQDNVRVAGYYYAEYSDDELILLIDGNSVFRSEYDKRLENGEMLAPIALDKDGNEKSRPAKRKTIKYCKLSGAEILEETEIVGDFIPVVPVMGIETNFEGKRYLRGIVRGVKDAQRMYNYNRSIIAEALSLTNRVPYIGAVGQFKTKYKAWQRANNTNFAFLEYDPVTVDGQIAPPPQRQAFAGPPSGLLADIQTSEHDIQAALGMYQASIGQNTNAKSGRALNSEKVAGDMATFHFPDNLGRSIRQVGRIIVSMVPKIYDAPRVVRILGEDGTPSHAQLNPEQSEAVTKYRDQDGAIKKIYNLGVGQYDVTVTTGASYATKRLEGAEFLTQVAQTNPDLMPVVGDLLFKSMDMPYAEEISERLKKMMPPQLQDTDEEGESPQVAQVKQQASMVIQQLQQQLQAAEQALQGAQEEFSQMKAKADDTQAKTAIDAKKLEIEAFKAETDRLNVQLQAAQQAEQDLTPQRLEMIEQAMAHMIDVMQPPQEAIQ